MLLCSLKCRENLGRAWATALHRDHSSGFQGLGKQTLTCFVVQFYWLEFTETESHVTKACVHFTLYTKMTIQFCPPPLTSRLLRSHTGVPHPCHVMQWNGNHWFTHSSKFREHLDIIVLDSSVQPEKESSPETTSYITADTKA